MLTAELTRLNTDLFISYTKQLISETPPMIHKGNSKQIAKEISCLFDDDRGRDTIC